MHIDDPTTHIVAGKRQWTDNSLQRITYLIGLLHESDKDSCRFGSQGFGIVLGEALEEAGFYKISTYKWKADWGCKVQFRGLDKSLSNVYFGENLRIFINDKAHEIKDIYPLWAILRRVWEVEHRD